MIARAYFLSALITGVTIGILGHLPLLLFNNCLVCVWIWPGAGLAVFLYQRLVPGGPVLTAGQGANLGALSGVIAALVGVIIYTLAGGINLPVFQSMIGIIEGMGSFTNLPPGYWGAYGIGLLACIDLVLYPLLGALGGMTVARML